jgi:endonuclease YncB( thermonuclease family)
MGCCRSKDKQKSILKKFRNIDPQTVSNWMNIFDGKILAARVIDIYDGDTCTCLIMEYDKTPYIIHIRLDNIDTCEMSSKNEIIRQRAYKARYRLYQLVSNTNNENEDIYISRKQMREKLNSEYCLVMLSCSKFDKYGRLLAKIYDVDTTIDNISKKTSFNQQLIQEKLAYEYNGKTKIPENELTNISLE